MEDSPAARAATQLAWEFESWKTIEVRLRQDSTVVQPTRDDDYNAIEEHYIETRVGQRLYDQKFMKGKEHARRQTVFCDGSKCATLNYVDKEPGTQSVSLP